MPSIKNTKVKKTNPLPLFVFLLFVFIPGILHSRDQQCDKNVSNITGTGLKIDKHKENNEK